MSKPATTKILKNPNTAIFDKEIIHWADYYKVPRSLVKAVIKKESNFNPWAIRVERGFLKRYYRGILNLVKSTVSKSDNRWLRYPDIFSCSYGLMQLMLPVAIELGFNFEYPTELLNPSTNIRYGCKKLYLLYERYGNWEDAISAYNQGNNRKLNGKYRNQHYVDSVLKFWKEYEKYGLI
ncbi:hypothetical protein DRO31_05275 [Candidatus Bathyarchaeota archaeon]|nr:MAG: hypothetical protein DRO31_05275 [Candidatus Bathyarchaeota archaeon]